MLLLITILVLCWLAVMAAVLPCTLSADKREKIFRCESFEASLQEAKLHPPAVH